MDVIRRSFCIQRDIDYSALIKNLSETLIMSDTNSENAIFKLITRDVLNAALYGRQKNRRKMVVALDNCQGMDMHIGHTSQVHQ